MSVSYRSHSSDEILNRSLTNCLDRRVIFTVELGTVPAPPAWPEKLYQNPKVQFEKPLNLVTSRAVRLSVNLQ